MTRLRSLDELFSRKSRQVKALELDVDSLSDEEKLDLMTKEPALVRRPIIEVDGELVVGFDAVRLAQLFDR